MMFQNCNLLQKYKKKREMQRKGLFLCFFLSLIRNCDLTVEVTHARKIANKFAFSLAYS